MSSESSELAQGPESEGEGGTLTLDRRAARPRGSRPEGPRLSGVPRQPRSARTAHHTPQDRGSGWGYRGRQAEKLDARQTSSAPRTPHPSQDVPPRSQ